MTQAFNLSQLANNLNTAGQLDATDGLVNAVPVTNGGTGASNEAAARTNLNVPTRTGGDASGTWGISISGNAATATSATTAGNGGVTSVNGSTGAVTVSTTPTTTQVLNATAGASVGSLGSYAMLSAGNGSITSFGLLINGAFLSFASATAGQSGTPVGTWRCMGYSSGAGITTASSVTLWLRAF